SWSASSASSSWTTAPGPPCARNWWATTRPMSRLFRAASGAPSNAPDHAPDEDPGGCRAGRFSPGNRRPSAALPGDVATRSIRWHGLRLSQSQGDGAESPDVRWPRILALPEAAFAGALSVVAGGGGRGHSAVGCASTVGVALRWRPDSNASGCRLAAGRPTDLIG